MFVSGKVLCGRVDDAPVGPEHEPVGQDLTHDENDGKVPIKVAGVQVQRVVGQQTEEADVEDRGEGFQGQGGEAGPAAGRRTAGQKTPAGGEEEAHDDRSLDGLGRIGGWNEVKWPRHCVAALTAAVCRALQRAESRRCF